MSSLRDAVKDRLRATRQWVPVSLSMEPPVVDVKLVTPRGEFDVTGNNAVAALRPLTLRLELDGQLRSALGGGEVRLHLVDRQLGRVIGVLVMGERRDWEVAGNTIGLFEVKAGRHYCAGWPRRVWDTWLYWRAARRAPPEKQIMTVAGVEQLMIFYLCPRPVHLIGVDDGRHSNIFPMDLVGPLPSGSFTLALRNTSVSVETIKSNRRLALSDLPASACGIAYRLGAHHKKARIDPTELPFKVLQSEIFSLPVPEIALRVREVEIIDFRTVGSHTLFVGRFRSERICASAPQLYHTSGTHQLFRSRHHQPLEEAQASA
jgi:flavin reductase (DIM6/NTAB) family NADH-FMN oxidoreductase RutF